MYKILAIKAVREVTGAGLREAKEIIESWEPGWEELPEKSVLMEQVIELAASIPPRDETYRKYIRRDLESINLMIAAQDDNELDDESVLAELTDAMNEIINAAESIRRMISGLEYVLAQNMEEE
ncbi:hypothetical protein LCGC14_0370040 [marine sediment metagenome]|uniref:Large ribosomal subunit protein bL12 C-terminal domain-containing protein n=1 Tax=marine sediment metagenome TaxID=412755 RepID=A0A0F9T5I6_9ZZZZ